MTQDNKKADTRDHGGGIDAAIAYYGGARNDWIDLSTGINPNPYPLPSFQSYHWTQLPDRAAFDAFDAAARKSGRSQTMQKLFPPLVHLQSLQCCRLY